MKSDIDNETLKKLDEDCELAMKETELTIELGLPWIDKNLLIVDLPGASGKSTSKVVQRLISMNVAAPVVIYVRSLEEKCAVNENLVNLLENMKMTFNEVYVSIVYTKSDLLEKIIFPQNEEEDETPEDKESRKKEVSNNIMSFLNSMKYINYKYISFDFLNPKNYLTKNPRKEQINTLSKFFNNVKNFALGNREYIKSNYLKMKLKVGINKIFSVENERYLSEEDLKELKNNVNSKIDGFKNFIKNFFTTFPKNSKQLQEKYANIHVFLKEELEKTKRKLLSNNGYFDKRNYIKDQLKENYYKFVNRVNENILWPEMKSIILNLFKEMNKKIKDLIDKLINKKDIEESSDLINTLLYLSTIGTELESKSNFKFSTLFYEVFVNFASGYLGFWSYDGAVEDIIAVCLSKYIEKSQGISECLISKSSEILNNIYSVVENTKILSDKAEYLKDIVDKHNFGDNYKSLDLINLMKSNIESADNETFSKNMKEFFTYICDNTNK